MHARGFLTCTKDKMLNTPNPEAWKIEPWNRFNESFCFDSLLKKASKHSHGFFLLHFFLAQGQRVWVTGKGFAALGVEHHGRQQSGQEPWIFWILGSFNQVFFSRVFSEEEALEVRYFEGRGARQMPCWISLGFGVAKKILRCTRSIVWRYFGSNPPCSNSDPPGLFPFFSRGWGPHPNYRLCG